MLRHKGKKSGENTNKNAGRCRKCHRTGGDLISDRSEFISGNRELIFGATTPLPSQQDGTTMLYHPFTMMVSGPTGI